MRGLSLAAPSGLTLHCRSGLLIAVASLAAEHTQVLEQASVVAAPGFQSTGSVAVVHGPHCPEACGVFSDPGSNLCPLAGLPWWLSL